MVYIQVNIEPDTPVFISHMATTYANNSSMHASNGQAVSMGEETPRREDFDQLFPWERNI